MELEVEEVALLELEEEDNEVDEVSELLEVDTWDDNDEAVVDCCELDVDDDELLRVLALDAEVEVVDDEDPDNATYAPAPATTRMSTITIIMTTILLIPDLAGKVDFI